jgi:hypothetical protein
MTDTRHRPPSVPPPQFGQQRRGQQTTVLYHGVSAMALKGLQDMGTNISGSSSSFSQLPTQSVRALAAPTAPSGVPRRAVNSTAAETASDVPQHQMLSLCPPGSVL